MNTRIKNVSDLYSALARVPINYAVQVSAFSQSTLRNVTTINEVQIDSTRAEIVLYTDATLVQVDSDHNREIVRQIADSRVECERLTEANKLLKGMIKTLDGDRANLCNMIALKDTEIAQLKERLKEIEYPSDITSLLRMVAEIEW